MKNFNFFIERFPGSDLSPSPSNANVLSWSKLDASVKDVTFIKKPPHLISKVKPIFSHFESPLIERLPQKPLRRVPINEPLATNNNCTPPDKKSKDEENEAFKSADVVVADQSSQMSNRVTDQAAAAKIPTVSPTSSAQFYRNWRELRDDSRKYSYLKVIWLGSINLSCVSYVVHHTLLPYRPN